MPVPLYVLRAVIDHVFVALPDQVEKTLPGNVTGLNNGNAHSSDLQNLRAPRRRMVGLGFYEARTLSLFAGLASEVQYRALETLFWPRAAR